MVGGFNTIYDMTGDDVFLERSIEIAKHLEPAFSTPTGLPKSQVNLRTGKSNLFSWTGRKALLAEVGLMRRQVLLILQHYLQNLELFHLFFLMMK